MAWRTRMEVDPSLRPRYTKLQLETYFERILLPQRYMASPVFSDPSLAKTREHGLPLVQALTRHHLCNVPFENLRLHYSVCKTISLDMADLFTNFAQDGLQSGRGGRCMETNGFFGTVLRSLGYEVRNCAGRVSRMMSSSGEVRRTQGDTYDGWNHMLNLVRLDGQWYVVDIGMGSMGPIIPFPLQDGYEAESVSPRRIRLQKRIIPEHAAARPEDAQPLWCFDVCFQPGSLQGQQWIPTYCFTETEYLPQDYEVMSWFTSTSPKSIFTSFILCAKMLLDDDGDEIIGDVTLFGRTIHKTIRGQKQLLRVCETEQERVTALEEIFHIYLSEEEKQSISGKVRI